MIGSANFPIIILACILKVIQLLKIVLNQLGVNEDFRYPHFQLLTNVILPSVE